MFEEEAEEYKDNTRIKDKNTYIGFPDERISEVQDYEGNYIDISERIIKTFKDGSKLGYNKANEWHYVKDGDLPKAHQKCYFIYSNVYGEDGKISFSKSDINVLTGIYAFFLDEETGEETTEPCFYDDINDDEIDLKEVYAWKEIVLPKEKEKAKSDN